MNTQQLAIEALDAFWQVIARHFPQATTGDELGRMAPAPELAPMVLRTPSRHACMRLTWPAVNMTIARSST